MFYNILKQDETVSPAFEAEIQKLTVFTLTGNLLEKGMLPCNMVTSDFWHILLVTYVDGH